MTKIYCTVTSASSPQVLVLMPMTTLAGEHTPANFAWSVGWSSYVEGLGFVNGHSELLVG